MNKYSTDVLVITGPGGCCMVSVVGFSVFVRRTLGLP